MPTEDLIEAAEALLKEIERHPGGYDSRPHEFEPTLRRGNPRNTGKRKTICKSGHPYTEANTIWRLVKGRKTRMCRECDIQRKRDARAGKGFERGEF